MARGRSESGAAFPEQLAIVRADAERAGEETRGKGMGELEVTTAYVRERRPTVP